MRKREIVRYIKAWLKLENDIENNKRACPASGCKLCRFYFKKVNFHNCPCHVYSYAYVVRKAKQIVKELEVKE